MKLEDGGGGSEMAFKHLVCGWGICLRVARCVCFIAAEPSDSKCTTLSEIGVYLFQMFRTSQHISMSWYCNSLDKFVLKFLFEMPYKWKDMPQMERYWSVVEINSRLVTKQYMVWLKLHIWNMWMMQTAYLIKLPLSFILSISGNRRTPISCALLLCHQNTYRYIICEYFCMEYVSQ